MSKPDNKRKKPNYYMHRKRKQFVLEPGLKGFLCSCNFREKECVREAYNILNLYADKTNEKIAEEEKVSSESKKDTKEDSSGVSKKHEDEKDECEEGTTKNSSSSEEDIEEELSKEITAMKKENQAKRFQVVESGAKNFVFIRATIDDPVKLAGAVFEDILVSKRQKTRFLLRLIPIEITCKANITDLKISFEPLLEKYFTDEPKSFAIVYNHRNNNSVNREEVIKELASLISGKNDKHSVNLKNADFTVVVEVIRGICLMSVVPNYVKFKKYNLLQLFEALEKDSNILEENENKECENVGNK